MTMSMDTNTFQWPHGNRAAVSLTFDDARPSQLDVGLDIMNRHQAYATFFVLPAAMKERADDWRTVVRQGHEIGNHTVTHPCSGSQKFARKNPLESYTLDLIEKELLDANAQIHEQLGLTPTTFAYPCGQNWVGRGRSHASYVPLVARHFKLGRNTGNAANSPLHCDPATLFSTNFDRMPADQAMALIQQAAELGNWLIFIGHDIGENPRQCVPTKTLEAICDYCMDPANRIWLDRMDRVGAYMTSQTGVDG